MAGIRKQLVPHSLKETPGNPTRLLTRSPVKRSTTIVNISSDEEDEEKETTSAGYKLSVPRTPRRLKANKIEAEQVIDISSSSDKEHFKNHCPPSDNGLLYSPVKVSHAVVDLTLSSSDEEDNSQRPSGRLLRYDKTHIRQRHELPGNCPTKRSAPFLANPVSKTEEVQYYGDVFDERWNAEDGLILTLNEPKAARRPFYPVLDGVDGRKAAERYQDRAGHTPPSSQGSHEDFSDDDEPVNVADLTPSYLGGPTECLGARPRVMRPSQSPEPQLIPDDVPVEKSPKKKNTAPRTGQKPPRMTKKAQQALEQSRRETYAQKLFDELNERVFKHGLPQNTSLKWSNRLLTTAGRARWRKSRDGSQTTEIELATKILDCDERIRNTLSHEMCHLACWIIDGDPKEGHGKAFKSWAQRIMRKRPEISITTRHNYEINYPYEWECGNCGKIYGRYSRSIRPEECRCGACKDGKLVPLFKVRPSKANAASRLASGTPRGSPRAAMSVGSGVVDLTLDDDDGRDSEVGRGREHPFGRKVGGSSTRSNVEVQLAALTEEMGGMHFWQ